MVIAIGPAREAERRTPLTRVEQRLLERGLPTDRMVQDEIAQTMEPWLAGLLGQFWERVWERARREINLGIIKMPPPEPVEFKQELAGSTLDGEDFWKEVAREWEEAAWEWALAQLSRVPQYTAQRFRFHVDMNAVNQAALEYTTTVYVPDLIRVDGPMSIVRSTWDQTVDILARWQRGELPKGRGLPDLEKALGTVYGSERAGRIAVTEATRIYAKANWLAWQNAYKDPRLEQALGINCVRWNTAADEFVCPICRPLNGKQEPITGQFPVPGGMPPAHVNCRCWISPIKRCNPVQMRMPRLPQP